MVKNIVLSFIVLLLAMQFVVAVDTQLTIKTFADHRVDISVLKVEEGYSLIKSFHETSDSSGNVVVSFSTSEDIFNVKVWIKQDNVLIVSEVFEEGFSVGESLELEVYPGWYIPPVEEVEDIVNETISEEVDDIEIIAEVDDTESSESEETSTIKAEESDFEIGLFIESFTNKKVLYYTVGGIIALFVVIIVILLIMKLLLDVRRGLRENKSSSGGDVKGKKKSIEEAKEKIKKTREEKQGIIEKAKKDMEETKKELKDLMGKKK